MNKRAEVNQALRLHYKTRTNFAPQVNKAAVPSFTRHNGRKIQRLGLVWRSPRGLQYNRSITEPKIGYKRAYSQRFILPDGTLPLRIFNVQDLLNYERLSTYESKATEAEKKHLYNLVNTYSSTTPVIEHIKWDNQNNLVTTPSKIKLVPIIAAVVGGRKRAELLKLAKEKNIFIKLTR